MSEATDEYINISELNINKNDQNDDSLREDYYESELEKHGKPIYQIQAYDNKNHVIIRQVGLFTKTPSILINKFDISDKIHCVLTSNFHDNKSIEDSVSESRFIMMKMLINHNVLDNLRPIGCINICFNSSEQLNDYNNHLSSKDNLKKINGSFLITFNYENKHILLEQIPKYLGNYGMLEKMLYYISTYEIKEILDNLTK
jgi:hypothetical protein